MMSSQLDWSARYELAPDVVVVQRDAHTVQVGTDEPRRTLIKGAPADTCRFLRTAGQASSLGRAIASASDEPEPLRRVCEQLAHLDLLTRAPDPGSIMPADGEAVMLMHRYGAGASRRALTARSDALVIVEGDTPVADAVTDLLAGIGIGHVHQRSHGPVGSRQPPRPPAKQRSRQTDVVWQRAADVRFDRPAPQMKPTAVVLAGNSWPDSGRAAELVTLVVPHIAVQISPARAVVGPLVLPGRSACLNCLERHRIDADPHWPAVIAALRARPRPPSTLLIHAAAGIVADQIGTLIDGKRRPAAVDATIERFATDMTIHRRPWTQHTDCGCHWVAAA